MCVCLVYAVMHFSIYSWLCGSLQFSGVDCRVELSCWLSLSIEVLVEIPLYISSLDKNLEFVTTVYLAYLCMQVVSIPLFLFSF